MAALDTAVPRCVRHEVVLALLQARAVADRDEAMKYASAAVELAAGDGLLQTVASEGAEVIDLVEQAAWRAPEEWLDRLRRATAEARTLGRPPVPTVIEPLTERERDVLRFLPSRLTVREIADELYVSVEHLEVPPPGHLPQARCELPCRGRRGGTHDDEAATVGGVHCSVPIRLGRVGRSHVRPATMSSDPRARRENRVRGCPPRRDVS